jgi:hypothetical protein
MLRIPQPPLSFCKVPFPCISIELPPIFAASLAMDPASLLSAAVVLS